MNLLKVDYIIQLALFLSSIILYFFFQEYIAIALLYFVLGGYQLITHIIKWYSGFQSTGRKFYNFCLWLIIIGNAVWILLYRMNMPKHTIFPVPIYLLLIMLVLGFGMAFLNIVISINEQKTDVGNNV